MSTLKIETRATASLRPSPTNSRKHTKEQIAKVVRSIQEFGWTNPILVDKAGRVIAGHARLEAAKSLGLTEVPTLALEHLNPAQVKAYCIADNSLALEGSSWDEAMLARELKALQDEKYDLSLTGIDQGETDRMLAELANSQSDGTKDPDRVGEDPTEPHSKPGDIWQCGKSRICCGSSLDAETVSRACEGYSPIRLAITDPPFELDAFDQLRACVLAGCTAAAVLGSGREWFRLLTLGGWSLRWDAVVVFNNVGALSRPSVLLPEHSRFAILEKDTSEPCPDPRSPDRMDVAIMTEGKSATKFSRVRFGALTGRQSSVQHTDRHRAGNHPLAKSESLFRPWVVGFEDGVIWDPFLGYGACLLACTIVGKTCIGMELEPKYVDLTVRRWQDFTGKKAVNAQTGKRFPG